MKGEKKMIYGEQETKSEMRDRHLKNIRRLETKIANLEAVLDILANDSDYTVRAALAETGHGLAKLVNDPNPFVRQEVARNSYGLDILINDPDENVKNMALAMKAWKDQETQKGE